MIQVYFCRIDHALENKDLATCLQSLSDYRRGKVLSCHVEKVRMQSLCTGLLLEEVFRRHGILEPYDYEVNPYGKTSLRGVENFHYSISHSGNFVFLALSNREIGIDIEEYQVRHLSFERAYSMAERFFSPVECSEIHTIDDFYRLWTLKEAYAKYLGCSLTDVISIPVNEWKARGRETIVEDGLTISLVSDELPSDFGNQFLASEVYFG